MGTLVSLRSRMNGAWISALGELPEPLAKALAGVRLGGLDVCPERQSLRLYLDLESPVPVPALDAVRERLGALGMKVVLYPRYPEGAFTAEDWLSLHFRDLADELREELDLAPDWLTRADYRIEGDLGRENVVLLAESDFHTKLLQERRAARKISDLIAASCGENVQADIRTGKNLEPAPALAPEPAPPAAGPGAPAAQGRPVEAKAPEAKAAEAKPAKPAAAPLPPEGRAIAGKLLPPGQSKPMAEMTGPMDSVMVEGKVFDIKETRIKSDKIKGKDGKPGERLKLRFAFSDGSDSMVGVFWPRPGEGAPQGLAVGATIRARGAAKVDNFERGELVLDAHDITLLPAAKGREDKAAEKRVELHAHTKMSAADSVVDPGALVKAAIKFGHPAIAITDHGVVHAFPAAAKAAFDKVTKKPAIKLILGCEGYLVENGDLFNDDGSLKGAKPEYFHVVILARTEAGRINLYKLVSESHLKTFYKKPLIPRARLEALREGLVLGSGCEQGELMQAVIKGADDATLERIAQFYDYLEVQPPGNNAFMLRNGEAADEEALRGFVRRVVALGERIGKPVVATGDVHYLHPQDEVYRRIMQVGNGMEDAEEQAPLWFRTTDEMLAEFSFLPPETAHRIVVSAPCAIAESIEHVAPVPRGRFFPKMEGAEERITEVAWAKARAVFGDPVPELAAKRLEYELSKIVGNGFAVLYQIARDLVLESNKRGFSVGSRGSVGSSLVAWGLGITEVNPLPAFERCEDCHWCEFHEKESLSGIDLKPRPCPKCGSTNVKRDGHNIPFETFVGFKGDKVPDIDLNFAPEVQNEVQKFAVKLFERGTAFKAGTVSTYSEKIAFGYVKKYYEAKGTPKRGVEIERIKTGLMEVKKNTGSHPGGVVLVPEGHIIEEFTPVQYSGDSKERGGRESKGGDMPITHFDYHAIDENLVKLDILGKDDGSAFRQLADLTGVNEQDVPLDDPAALSLFRDAKALNLPKLAPEEMALFGTTGALAIPEFGTSNTRRMLEMTRPKNFTELIYISGLSHGTNVWATNAEELVKSGKATLATVISTRDDIMTRLIQADMDAAMAFNITEKVRKGRAAAEGFTPEEEQALRKAKVPDWFVDSCKKIQYMFPKAHAAAYCFTAVRMAWFKVHHPAAFYATWLTLNAASFELDAVLKGKAAMIARIGAVRQAQQAGTATAKDEGVMELMVVALEATLRGIKFLPVELYESHPSRFTPREGALLPPLTAIPGLGGTAAERVAQERALGQFRSAEEMADRCGLNKTVVEKLKESGALGGLPDSDQISLF